MDSYDSTNFGRHTIQKPYSLSVDFTKAFDSIHYGKMKEILFAYRIPKETVDAIMILLSRHPFYGMLT